MFDGLISASLILYAKPEASLKCAQWGVSPHRTDHWLSVAEGNRVAEMRGGEQPEANDQSIIKKMMNSIRPDALVSLLGESEDLKPDLARTSTQPARIKI